MNGCLPAEDVPWSAPRRGYAGVAAAGVSAAVVAEGAEEETFQLGTRARGC